MVWRMCGVTIFVRNRKLSLFLATHFSQHRQTACIDQWLPVQLTEDAPPSDRLERGLHFRGREGHGAQPGTSCIVDGVSDRGWHNGRGRLAGTPRLFGWAVYEPDRDVRHIRKLKDWIARP